MADSMGKKASQAFVWVLMALLILGLAGFGVSSFGGSASAVGSVGKETITLQQYYRALLNASRAAESNAGQSLSFAELQARGVPEQVRGQLAGLAALDNETARLGLSVGDQTVAEQVRSQPAFGGLDGNFDRTAYENTLQRNGWSVREFETLIRKESARTILQSAVGGGIAPADDFMSLIMDFVGERRSFDWVRFQASDLAALPAPPNEAEITAYYEANPQAFTLPQRKQVTYAWLDPETLIDQIDADEDRLRTLYEERIDDYVQPERRLVERLVFGTNEAAEAAKAAIDAGEARFADLVSERGLELEDVDLGEVTRDDLGAAADAVFDLDGPGVVGPHETDLGPALFRMNAILNASEVSFEQARDDLALEFTRNSARREAEARISDYDDRLAAGATVEELAAETEMVTGTVEVWPGASGGLADYQSFRDAVAALTEDDFPQIEILEDGGIYAMRLDAVLEPSLQPLDQVRDAATEGAAAAALTDALRALAESARTTAEATEGLTATGPVETAELITRNATAGSAPAALIARAFEMSEGETAIVEAGSSLYLLQLTAIEGTDPDDTRMELTRTALAAQVSQSLSDDIQGLFSQAMMNAAGVEFSDSALNAVHSQIVTGN